LLRYFFASLPDPCLLAGRMVRFILAGNADSAA